jgi:hypothetical protein
MNEMLLLPPIGTPSSEKGELEKETDDGAEETVSEIVPVVEVDPALPVNGRLRAPGARVLAALKTCRTLPCAPAAIAMGNEADVVIPAGKVIAFTSAAADEFTWLATKFSRKLLAGRIVAPAGVAQMDSTGAAAAGRTYGVELNG